MDLDERQLYAESILGKDAEQFFKTELGQYVIGMSAIEVAEIHEKMETAKTSAISDLQKDVLVAKKALLWINDAIHLGKQALGQLEAQEDLVEE